MISASGALPSGRAVVGGELGSDNVSIYAKQLEEAVKSQSVPDENLAAGVIQAKRSKVLYLIDTVFITMMAPG